MSRTTYCPLIRETLPRWRARARARATLMGRKLRRRHYTARHWALTRRHCREYYRLISESFQRARQNSPRSYRRVVARLRERETERPMFRYRRRRHFTYHIATGNYTNTRYSGIIAARALLTGCLQIWAASFLSARTPTGSLEITKVSKAPRFGWGSLSLRLTHLEVSINSADNVRLYAITRRGEKCLKCKTFLYALKIENIFLLSNLDPINSCFRGNCRF